MKISSIILLSINPKYKLLSDRKTKDAAFYQALILGFLFYFILLQEK